MYKNDTAIRQRAISTTSTNFVLGNFFFNSTNRNTEYQRVIKSFGELFCFLKKKSFAKRKTFFCFFLHELFLFRNFAQQFSETQN